MRSKAPAFTAETFADALFRMVFISDIALQESVGNAQDAGPIDFVVTLKSAQQELSRLLARNVRVTEIECQLPVCVGQIHILQKGSLASVLLIEGCARHRRVQHELVKVRIVGDGIIDDLVNFFGRVRFQSDNAGTQDAYSVRLEVSHQLMRINPAEL